MPGLAFCMDGGPGGWASAQANGDPAAMRAAVEKTFALGTAADRAGIDSLWLLEDTPGGRLLQLAPPA